MIVAGITFPDKCPTDCPFLDHVSRYGQNAICDRCPLFVCERCDDGDGGTFCLVDPEEYRPDWAEVWRQWFDDGMQGYPVLPLASPESVER